MPRGLRHEPSQVIRSRRPPRDPHEDSRRPFSVNLSGANNSVGIAQFADGRSAAKLHWDSNIELQKWIDLHVVDFAEIFRGHGEATIRVRETGCLAAEGFDKAAITYERPWNLDRLGDQADLAFLIVYVLRPKVIHIGTPCTENVRGRR